jgi:uncharacterized protein (TIGR03435 family)
MRCIVFLLLLIPSLFAQARPEFEVASIRPTAGPIPGVPPMLGQQRTTVDTLTVRHTPLREIIRKAYGLLAQELIGGPDWINEARFDIAAKSEKPASDAELWAMVQPLLVERFNLKFRREKKEVSGLALVVDKKGFKGHKSEGGSNHFAMEKGVFRGHNVPLSSLGQLLSSVMQRPVVDTTGLKGTYDFSIEPAKYRTDQPADLQSLVIIAFQEEMGLKMESRKVEINTLVIDHIEPPSEN